ncbi:MAG: hypothetical protein ACKORF_07260 [Micrococcales bacterium]
MFKSSFKLAAAATLTLGMIVTPLVAQAYPAGHTMAVTVNSSTVAKGNRAQAKAINVAPYCFVKFYQNKTNSLSGATYLSQQQANLQGVTGLAQVKTSQVGTFYIIGKVTGTCTKMKNEPTQASTTITVVRK